MTSFTGTAAGPILLLALGLASCSSAVPTDDQRTVKGYGVQTVAGDSLSAMLARCSQAGQRARPTESSASLDAECEQLRRTQHAQPGNSVSE